MFETARLILDWIAGVAALIFIWQVTSKHRAWLANWNARRTQTGRQKRIKKLEAELATMETIPAVTQFEDIALSALSVCLAVSFVIVVMATEMITSPAFVPLLVVGHEKAVADQIAALTIVVLVSLVALSTLRRMKKFYRTHSPTYRETLRTSIYKLKQS